MSILYKTIKDVITCYSKLVEINSKFCLNPVTAETVNEMNGKRAVIIDDIDIFFNILNKCPEIESIGDESFNNPLESISILARKNAKIAELKDEMSAKLKELVRSDKLVEELIQAQTEEIKTEVKKLRLGAKNIRGYIQKNPTGSCFINKIK